MKKTIRDLLTYCYLKQVKHVWFLAYITILILYIFNRQVRHFLYMRYRYRLIEAQDRHRVEMMELQHIMDQMDSIMKVLKLNLKSIKTA